MILILLPFCRKNISDWKKEKDIQLHLFCNYLFFHPVWVKYTEKWKCCITVSLAWSTAVCWSIPQEDTKETTILITSASIKEVSWNDPYQSNFDHIISCQAPFKASTVCHNGLYYFQMSYLMCVVPDPWYYLRCWLQSTLPTALQVGLIVSVYS